MSDTKNEEENKEQSQHPNYFSLIPLTALDDPSLPDGAKLLLARITSLANNEGRAWAQNAYFAKKHNTSERTIGSWIQRLREEGYIKVFHEYYPNSKKVKRRYIYPVIDPAGKREKDAPGLVVKYTSPPGGEVNFQDNNISFNNIKAAAADLRDQTFSEVEKPLEKAATALFDEGEIEKLEIHFKQLNPKLVFDKEFYPKALGFLNSHKVGLNFVTWVYDLCAKKNPRDITAYLYRVFLEERYVELFREAVKPPPEKPIILISCPVCALEHDRDDPVCPSCGLRHNADEYDVSFKKAFLALPLEKQDEYKKEEKEICGFGLNFETGIKINALREKFHLPIPPQIAKEFLSRRGNNQGAASP